MSGSLFAHGQAEIPVKPPHQTHTIESRWAHEPKPSRHWRGENRHGSGRSSCSYSKSQYAENPQMRANMATAANGDIQPTESACSTTTQTVHTPTLAGNIQPEPTESYSQMEYSNRGKFPSLATLTQHAQSTCNVTSTDERTEYGGTEEEHMCTDESVATRP